MEVADAAADDDGDIMIWYYMVRYDMFFCLRNPPCEESTWDFDLGIGLALPGHTTSRSRYSMKLPPWYPNRPQTEVHLWNDILYYFLTAMTGTKALVLKLRTGLYTNLDLEYFLVCNHFGLGYPVPSTDWSPFSPSEIWPYIYIYIMYIYIYTCMYIETERWIDIHKHMLQVKL